MNITLTIPDNALPAWEARLAQFNVGSGQSPVTIEQLNQSFLDEETARLTAAHHAALRALMTTTADEIIAVAGGDMTKLTAAVQAGKTAALGVLA